MLNPESQVPGAVILIELVVLFGFYLRNRIYRSSERAFFGSILMMPLLFLAGIIAVEVESPPVAIAAMTSIVGCSIGIDRWVHVADSR